MKMWWTATEVWISTAVDWLFSLLLVWGEGALFFKLIQDSCRWYRQQLTQGLWDKLRSWSSSADEI